MSQKVNKQDFKLNRRSSEMTPFPAQLSLSDDKMNRYVYASESVLYSRLIWFNFPHLKDSNQINLRTHMYCMYILVKRVLQE